MFLHICFWRLDKHFYNHHNTPKVPVVFMGTGFIGAFGVACCERKTIINHELHDIVFLKETFCPVK